MKQQVDYYEFLQISPNAEQETIHRVYRFLGARYHPDNPQSGNVEAFSQLKNAYETLSDPERRAEYDTSFRKEAPAPDNPMSDSVDFMDAMEGEINRRLAVMAVLYSRRRTHPASPEVTLSDLEIRMGFPRDYLDFTTWYLKKKDLIAIGDNASFSLTVQGVDHVESERLHIPTLHKLLTNGSPAPAVDPPANGKGHSNGNGHANGNGHSNGNGHAHAHANGNGHSNGVSAHSNGHAHMPELPVHVAPEDRRLGAGDRRTETQDRRQTVDPHPAVERRISNSDRRSGNRDRRKRS